MISIENLYFSYTGSAPYVLDNITLYLNKGEYVSVLGENGCGKSTLIRLILKLAKPVRGTISCQAKRIGYVPQKTDFLNTQFPITVEEMLHCYRKLLKLKDKSAVEKSLETVKMTDYRNSLIGNLSGGQCQKIFIARALMGSPELLILDEPSTGVDIGSQKEIYGLLSTLNRENGITIVSVEHNLDAAIKNSTLIYHLSNGNGHLCTPDKYIREFLNANRGGSPNA